MRPSGALAAQLAAPFPPDILEGGTRRDRQQSLTAPMACDRRTVFPVSDGSGAYHVHLQRISGGLLYDTTSGVVEELYSLIKNLNF